MEYCTKCRAKSENLFKLEMNEFGEGHFACAACGSKDARAIEKLRTKPQDHVEILEGPDEAA